MLRFRFAVLIAALLLASPGAAWAQSAGDEQYEDPFGDEPGQSGGGGSSGGGESSDDGSSSSSGTVQPSEPEAAAPAEPAAPATTAQAPDGGEELARTGADAGAIALAGALLLATGLALRRRSGWRGDRA